jgi:hypothetical protein
MEKTQNEHDDIIPDEESIFLYDETANDRSITTPSPILIESKPKNEIITLLYNLINDKFHIDKLKLSINISDKSIQLIQTFLKHSPEIFTKLSTDIQVILEDDILDLADLPQIIVLVKDIYNINFKKLGKNVKNISIEQSIQFIKDLILILIELNYILVNNKTKVINIVESSVNLLSSSIQIAPTIFNLFTCCC